MKFLCALSLGILSVVAGRARVLYRQITTNSNDSICKPNSCSSIMDKKYEYWFNKTGVSSCIDSAPKECGYTAKLTLWGEFYFRNIDGKYVANIEDILKPLGKLEDGSIYKLGWILYTRENIADDCEPDQYTTTESTATCKVNSDYKPKDDPELKYHRLNLSSEKLVKSLYEGGESGKRGLHFQSRIGCCMEIVKSYIYVEWNSSFEGRKQIDATTLPHDNSVVNGGQKVISTLNDRLPSSNGLPNSDLGSSAIIAAAGAVMFVAVF